MSYLDRQLSSMSAPNNHVIHPPARNSVQIRGSILGRPSFSMQPAAQDVIFEPADEVVEV